MGIVAAILDHLTKPILRSLHMKFFTSIGPVILEMFERLSRDTKLAVTRDFQQCGMCDQQRLRQACTYA